jgi:hypothetical protein
MTNKPVLNFRDGALSAGVFEGDNERGKFFNISLQRSFKKKDSDEWERQSLSLFPEDLLKIAVLCERTYNGILDLKQNTPKEQVSAPARTKQETPVQSYNNDEIPF